MNSYYRHTKFLAALAIIFFANLSYAQKNKDLHFLQLPFEGLSHPTVNCIFQDEVGFLWLGTINGLNRFDGYEYSVYQSHENFEKGLSNNYVNSINQDPEGNLWVATKYGLNILMEAGNYFKTYLSDENNPNSIINNNTEIVYRDSKDRMWVGSWGGLSLYRKTTNDFINFTHDQDNENSISGHVVTAIMEDSKGRLWIGTAFSGLNLLDPGTNKFQRFEKEATEDNCISGNSISAIYEDEKGQIWVGAERGGLNRFNEESQTFKWYLNEEKITSIASNTVYSIIEDENGDLMVGGMNGGISVYNSVEDNFSRYDTHGNYNPFGSKASVFSHYKLRSGEVVIATSNGGVKIQDNYPTAIELHKHIQGNRRTLRMNNVSAISEDQKGNFWVGTAGGGLNYMDAKTREFKSFPIFKDKTVNSLYFDKAGNLWIGTLENGLAVYDVQRRRFRYYSHKPEDQDGISANHVRRLIENGNGLWIGTDEGVDLFNPETKQFSHFSHAANGSERRKIGQVNGLLVDYTYKLWLASESGLHYYDEDSDQFRSHKYQPSVSGRNHDWISYFYEDSRQHIWLSTLNGNLTLLDVNRKPVEPVVINPNYEITEVTNIIEDSNGFFWITCRKGLFQCQVDHRKYTVKVLNTFNSNDGLQGDLFNSNAALISKTTGEILLGGLNGLNIFNPVQMKLNPNFPPVVLTKLSINGKKYKTPDGTDLSQLEELSLSKKEASTIDIYFTALNYVKSRKNQYAYMLEGYDENWRYAGNRRMASYSNLSPGKYNLKIKATNNHGVWNSRSPGLKINISQPFWETSTFRFGLIGLGIVALALGFLFYLRSRARGSVHLSIRDLIFRHHNISNHSLAFSKNSHDQAFVERVVAYVESNIDNDEMSIESMCTELGLSRAQLFRKIKDLTGQTVSNFIKDIRLEKAKLYLDSHPRSVSEVAFAIGFKSHAHFTRSFKEKFGISPSAYAQSNV